MRLASIKVFLVVFAVFLLISTLYHYQTPNNVVQDNDETETDGYGINKKGDRFVSKATKQRNRKINLGRSSRHGKARNTKTELSELDARPSKHIIEILQWTNNGAFKREGHKLFSKCKYKGCTISSNKSRIDDADAVVMTAFEISILDLQLPRYHHPWQKWVFLAMEPPVKVNITSQYNDVFNVTVTFRDDADVHFKYLQTVPLPSNELDQVLTKQNYAAGKSRLAAWMVSHCDAVNRRLDYVTELQKYVIVDIYGNCGAYKCGNKYGWVECRALLDISYKFYLAFENGFCPGYLTEKIWAALTGNVLPIVMGGADYGKYLPPNSYLDVRNFSSPEKLADYMKLLDEDDELYNSYFEWKTSYKLLEERDSPHWCELCEHLHTVRGPSTYPQLDKWYNDCVDPNVYYKGVADMLVENL